MAVVPSADSLTCIVPSDGNFWPFGGQPTPVVPGETSPWGTSDDGGSEDLGTKVGLGVGIPLGIFAAAFFAWWFRKWYFSRSSVVNRRFLATREKVTGAGGAYQRKSSSSG